jgi:hypothetical protein
MAEGEKHQVCRKCENAPCVPQARPIDSGPCAKLNIKGLKCQQKTSTPSKESGRI